MIDPYVEANRALLLSRSQTGKAKYGTDLTRDDLTDEQWLQHAIEEALDFANYLQVIKARLRNNASKRIEESGGEPKPKDPLSLLPIVVGGWYRLRNGEHAKIERDDGSVIPFRSTDGLWFYPDGQSMGGHSFDILERIA